MTIGRGGHVERRLRQTGRIIAGCLLGVIAPLIDAQQPAEPRERLEREFVRLQVELDRGQQAELETLIVKPRESTRLPLALITHGSPRDAAARRRMTAGSLSFQAEELARRGYLAAVVMRRGYASSDGDWAERYGRCDDPDYEHAARESARDLRAAIRILVARPDVDGSRVIAIGQSAGGIAVIALAADPVEGLRGVVSFAGGRGSLKPNQVCREDRLVSAYAAFGASARVPSLWIYTENDLYFRPDLSRRMFAAYQASGGAGEFHLLPPFERDGHALFHRRSALPAWRPLLDSFLGKHRLPTWSAPPAEPVIAPLSPPSALDARGQEHWRAYLESADHRAFAVSPSGLFGWRSGRDSLAEARADALRRCKAVDCRIVAENERAR